MALVTNDYFLCKLVIAFSTSKYHERSYIFIPIDSSHRELSIDMKIIGLRRRRHLLHFCQDAETAAIHHHGRPGFLARRGRPRATSDLHVIDGRRDPAATYCRTANDQRPAGEDEH